MSHHPSLSDPSGMCRTTQDLPYKEAMMDNGQLDASPGAVLTVTQSKLRTVVLLTRVRTVGMVP